MKSVNVNRNIRATSVLLIGEGGGNLGNIKTSDALSQAIAANLDLVQVGTSDGTPVCKIMDFGKWKYEQSKKQKRNKTQKKLVKEIKFRPNTSGHDMSYRAKHADEFIGEGHKVKLIVRFRGREQEHMYKTGQVLLEKFLLLLKSEYSMMGNAKVEGKAIVLELVPSVKK